ncbi:Zinc finger protein [Plakobranchus ocellatus]|uniref:Zinc finger protein n=1 Tax=Plakobranchus ocellatus TaxID=259542 RepID=A0AAV4B406_9GAST|nr:Zinc finger protein [Plakobranchus ocellatus]
MVPFIHPEAILLVRILPCRSRARGDPFSLRPAECTGKRENTCVATATNASPLSRGCAATSGSVTDRGFGPARRAGSVFPSPYLPPGTTATRYIHPCPKCGRRFTKGFNMRRHLKKCETIDSAVPQSCPVCQKFFISVNELYSDMGVPPHTFDQESLGPAGGLTLPVPGTTSTTTTRYIHACPQCGRRFTTRSNMTRHLKKCGTLGPAGCDPCPICGKTFISPDSLKTHMAIAHYQQ